MIKHVSRTYGQLHFEDLDPMRFEDLARQLSYGFKQWLSLEDTGSSGSDGGYDSRGIENNGTSEKPMLGNLWMIQAKRYKVLGPKLIGQIIDECLKNKKDIPYGFILIAPVDFSLKTRESFRNKMLVYGVKEFHLWGKGELEDKLFLPENDHLLYAYFGISLSARKKNLASKINPLISMKNKLISSYGLGQNDYLDTQKKLIIKDPEKNNYPYDEAGKGKEKNWGEVFVLGCYPNELVVCFKEYYAYVNQDKKEYDLLSVDNLESRRTYYDHLKNDSTEAQEWGKLKPENKYNMAYLGFIPYENIISFDKTGDIYYDEPQIYVTFNGNDGPFDRVILEGKEAWREGVNKPQKVIMDESYSRVKKFKIKKSSQEI
jgi:hypothetical protein